MPRGQLPLLLGGAILGAVAVLLYLNRRPAEVETMPTDSSEVIEKQEVATPDPEPMPELGPLPSDEPADPQTALENAGIGARDRDAGRLVARIAEAFEGGDWELAADLIGRDALTPEVRQQLLQLAARDQLELHHPDPAREVGEIELNQRARWLLRFRRGEDADDRIFLDLALRDGAWAVEKLSFPPAPTDPAAASAERDALAIADAFLDAALGQDFERAKRFVDSSAVSDAKIAALCILFEEGKYRLRERKPLRAMLSRENLAGFLAHVEVDRDQAQFSLMLGRAEPEQPWRLSEINLDKLLADYASRVAGGDVYYTPLVKNPEGGDTLVLYFDFDADGLTPRTERQLEIVAELLSVDPDKRLTLSGHTDSLGTPQYNRGLSARRAATVKEFLVSCGVGAGQIITVAEGQTQPRRPNTTPEGEDNPEGRRANRRTEIYLDF